MWTFFQIDNVVNVDAAAAFGADATIIALVCVRLAVCGDGQASVS